MNIEDSFDFICRQAVEAKEAGAERFVSLYVRDRLYGGPEEGGWWYSVIALVRYQEFATEEQAAKAKTAVEELAKCKTREAMMEHGERCLRELEWLDARMIDDYDWLGSPTGPSEYFVCTEAEPGSQEYRGNSTYE